MAYTLSPLMNLPIPGVGTEAGPNYADDVNNSLTIIDSHDHSPGYGQAITPAGMNITSDLTFGGNSITGLKTVRFSPQSVAPTDPADLGCLYEVGNDLYFTDGTGTSIRITQSGAVAGTPGSISNLVSPASASYSSAAKTFTFQSAALTPANLDGAAIVLRNLVASSFGMTVQPPTLSADATVTLPALPLSNLPLSMDSSGVITAAQVTLAQLSSQVQALLASIANTPPPGVISSYGGTSAPSGYLLCDGSAVSRTTYSALYGAIGNAFGAGNGTTTFNVPDLRGYFLRGVDGGSTRDPDAASRTAMNAGGNTGDAVGSVQMDAMQNHSHNTFSAAVGSGGTLPGVVRGNNDTGGTTIQHGGSPSGGVATNQGSPFTAKTVLSETRSINAATNFIIKT